MISSLTGDLGLTSGIFFSNNYFYEPLFSYTECAVFNVFETGVGLINSRGFYWPSFLAIGDITLGCPVDLGYVNINYSKLGFSPGVLRGCLC